MPSPASVHLDANLSGYVNREVQAPGIADDIAPAFPVTHKSDKYLKFGTESMNVGEVKPRAARAQSGEGRWATGQGQFVTQEYPWKTPVEQDTIDNADPAVDPMENASRYVKGVVMLAWESRLRTMLYASANFGTVNAAAAAWTTAATGIEADVDTAKEGVSLLSGHEANTIVIPPGIARQIKRNSTLRDLIKATDPTLLVNGDLPNTLWGLKVVIPSARQNLVNEGQTASITRLYPTSGAAVQVLYVDPDAGNQSATWAATFRWSKFGVGGEGIRTWWVDDGRYWYVEYATYQAEVVVSTACGALITGV